MALIPGEDFTARPPVVFNAWEDLLAEVRGIRPFWRRVEISVATDLGWQILFRMPAFLVPTAPPLEPQYHEFRLLVAKQRR
jgi:hypothetical protein